MAAQPPHRSDGKGEALAPATARPLEVGEKFTIDVIARRHWNNTGLHVTAGQRYQLTAHGTWVDFYIPCGASGYRYPGWLLRGPLGLATRFMQGRRRVPEGNWFVLAGAVRAAEDCRYFVAGSSREVRMPASGQLAFFANDLPGFYWNNLGCIRLEIARLS
jgi:hypothetical protein